MVCCFFVFEITETCISSAFFHTLSVMFILLCRGADIVAFRGRMVVTLVRGTAPFTLSEGPNCTHTITYAANVPSIWNRRHVAELMVSPAKSPSPSQLHTKISSVLQNNLNPFSRKRKKRTVKTDSFVTMKKPPTEIPTGACASCCRNKLIWNCNDRNWQELNLSISSLEPRLRTMLT